MNADLEVSFPPVPPVDSVGAPSRASIWRVYINGQLKEQVPTHAVQRRYTVDQYGAYRVQVSLVNELGEGQKSPATVVTHEQPKGLPSRPGAPSVTLTLHGGSVGGGPEAPTGSDDWTPPDEAYVPLAGYRWIHKTVPPRAYPGMDI